MNKSRSSVNPVTEKRPSSSKPIIEKKPSTGAAATPGNTSKASLNTTRASQSLVKPTAMTQREVVTGNVHVYCRFRPLNQREINTTEDSLCVTFKDEKTCAV
jgi:kinesin family protein 5